MIIVREHRDLAEIDRIIKDPAIRAATSDDSSPSQVSAAELLSNPASVALRVELDGALGGYFLCLWMAPGIYQVHTMMLPNCRGRSAIEAGRFGCDFMFTRTDCDTLVSYARSNHPEVFLFAKLVGFQVDWTRKGNALVGDQPVDTEYLSLSIHEWLRWSMARSHFQHVGSKFHAQFFAEVGRLHPDDENHNGIIGICLEMAVAGGQYEKAQLTFNRWAAVAGYMPIAFQGLRNGWVFFKCGSRTTLATVAVDRNYDLQLICQSGQPSGPQPSERELPSTG